MKGQIPSDLWWKCWIVLCAITSPAIGQTTIEHHLPPSTEPRQVQLEFGSRPGETTERATVQLAPGTSSVSVTTSHDGHMVTRHGVSERGPDREPVCAPDWNNFGGNCGRYGLSSEVGPSAESLLWWGGRPSIIAWTPVIEGGRMFMVRQLAFPSGEPDASPIVATELGTGAELWIRHLPFNSGDWTTWIAGARDGRVYASRSGDGAWVSARLHALDAATGATVWMSADETTAGPYDGVVFAPNGDLIVGSFYNVMRIRADDGTTLWNSPRICSVAGFCGAAIHGDAVYVADVTVGGHEIVRYDLATGAEMYASSTMPGILQQNTPTAGPDGTVYLSRTQNNPSTDYFYAFEDTGAGLVQKWSVPAGWTTASMYGIGPDGSVYMIAPGDVLVRLNPANGGTLNSAGALADFDSPRGMAIDGTGKLFLSNGASATGRLHVFEANLTALWDVAVENINIGGPAMGRGGTIVVAGIGYDVRAFRESPLIPGCFLFGDGFESGGTSAWSQ